jgi:DNA-binding CsgD family transcriptional regulator
MRLQRYLDISQASTLETFKHKLVSFAHDSGFELATVALLIDRPGKPSTVLSVSNTPEAFSAASKSDADAARDPVLNRLKKLSVPFIYDQSLYVKEGAADLWEEQAAFGYKTGISVALHLPRERHFLLGMDRETPLPRQDAKLTRMLADLQFLAVHAQDAASRLLLAELDALPSDSPTLTQRETEVLKWTMEGKSAWAVGEILAISEHTVNFHFRNIFKKLHASSKHQAVLKAMALGLL